MFHYLFHSAWPAGCLAEWAGGVPGRNGGIHESMSTQPRARPPASPCTVPEGAAVDDAVGGRESAVEVGGHAVRHDLGVRGEARALAPRAPAEAPASVPPECGDDIIEG